MLVKRFIAKIYYFLKLLKATIFCAPKKIKYGNNFVFLLLTPKHGNLGDHAIAKAEKAFFKDLYIYELVGEDIGRLLRYNYGKAAIRLLFGKHMIFVHGGGYLGSLYPDADESAMRIIETLQQNKIIILPQTVYYDENDAGKQWLKQAEKIYNSHPNLTVCTREKISYELTRNFFENTYLIPDMVLSLNECKDDVFRRGVAICLRSDREKTLTDGEYDSVINFAQSDFDNVIYADMVMESTISQKARERRLNEQFDKFRGAELVITDRLHGMIFAAITGTPCAVLNSKSHKVKGVYDWCLSDLEYIRFVDSVEEISEFYNQIKGKTFVYDNTKLKPYYEKLLELIK